MPVFVWLHLASVPFAHLYSPSTARAIQLVADISSTTTLGCLTNNCADNCIDINICDYVFNRLVMLRLIA